MTEQAIWCCADVYVTIWTKEEGWYSQFKRPDLVVCLRVLNAVLIVLTIQLRVDHLTFKILALQAAGDVIL
jgi:hypothetical protein